MWFAKDYIDNDENYGHTVITTGECKVNLFGTDSQTKSWIKKKLLPTVKHGAGSAEGVGKL